MINTSFTREKKAKIWNLSGDENLISWEKG